MFTCAGVRLSVRRSAVVWCLGVAAVALGAGVGVGVATDAVADELRVAPGESVQAAIDRATDGDVILLEAGRYDGDLDFGGKAVTVRGVGPATHLVGSGGGPVVTFDDGEGEGSVLDSVTVRGGRAVRGGGVLISGADPVVVRCVVKRNRASSQGSGIWIGGGSRAVVANNLVTHNRHAGGDPHGIEIVDAAPVILHNTITRHDSNGLILRGSSDAVVRGNVFAWNGKRIGKRLRGRGICDFSGGRAELVGNLFHRNRIAALLRGGRDWRKVRGFQRTFPSDTLVRENVDGNPGFRRRRPAGKAKRARYRHFDLRKRGRGVRARDTGSTHPDCVDRDGSAADLGHTGGPFAPGTDRVPTRADCLPDGDE